MKRRNIWNVSFIDEAQWLRDDVLLYCWSQWELDFIVGSVQLAAQLLADHSVPADEMVCRIEGGFQDTQPEDSVRQRLELLGSPPLRIRRVGWECMRGPLRGRNRPKEPRDTATWETVNRDLDLIERWCDEQELKRPAAVDAAPSPSDREGEKPVIEFAGIALYGPDKAPSIDGIAIERITLEAYRVLLAMLEAGPAGLSGTELVKRSTHTDAVNILKRLRAGIPQLTARITLAGKPRGRYRVSLTTVTSR